MFKDVDNIVEVLEKGGVVIYPTDTIWGIGCDAFNEPAIRKIYAIKEREADKPFVVLVSDLAMLNQYVVNIHPRIESLLYFHEKPLTVVYSEVNDFPELLRGENGTVAIRVVGDAYCQEFISKLGKPIVSTSVNRSGQVAPVHFAEIDFDMLDSVDYVSEHRRCDKFEAQASAIISYNSNGKIRFLR